LFFTKCLFVCRAALQRCLGGDNLLLVARAVGLSPSLQRWCHMPSMPAALSDTLWFLHFPKCGTSFHSTINRFVCPGVPTDCVFEPGYECHIHGTMKNLSLLEPAIRRLWNCSQMFREYMIGHSPAGYAPISRGAAMFRSPSQRFLSSPLHLVHRSPLLDAVAPNISLALVARWPGRQGCMTKALTGHHCWEPLDKADANAAVALAFHALSTHSGGSARWVLDRFMEREALRLAALLPGAIKAVRSLAFVGLTELWDASIALFHHSFSKRGFAATEAELFNMRKHSQHSKPDFDIHQQEADTHLYDASVLGGLWDDAEERVYAEARARFQADIANAILMKRKKDVPAPDTVNQ